MFVSDKSTDEVLRYWLFSAALIVFSNGFANVCTDVDTGHAMQTALNLMQYLGEVDPLARRYNHILLAFHAAITRKDTVTANNPPTGARASNENIFNAFFGGIGGAGAGTGAASQPLHAGSASLNHRRESSHAQSTNINNAGVISTIQATPNWQPYLQPSSTQSDPIAAAMVTGRDDGPGAMGTGTGIGISPPDYCLDFDVFLSSVGVGGSESVGQNQDISGYGPDSWMPLYGTMDLG